MKRQGPKQYWESRGSKFLGHMNKTQELELVHPSLGRAPVAYGRHHLHLLCELLLIVDRDTVAATKPYVVAAAATTLVPRAEEKVPVNLMAILMTEGTEQQQKRRLLMPLALV